MQRAHYWAYRVSHAHAATWIRYGPWSQKKRGCQPCDRRPSWRRSACGAYGGGGRSEVPFGNEKSAPPFFHPTPSDHSCSVPCREERREEKKYFSIRLTPFFLSSFLISRATQPLSPSLLFLNKTSHPPPPCWCDVEQTPRFWRVRTRPILSSRLSNNQNDKAARRGITSRALTPPVIWQFF